MSRKNGKSIGVIGFIRSLTESKDDNDYWGKLRIIWEMENWMRKLWMDNLR